LLQVALWATRNERGIGFCEDDANRRRRKLRLPRASHSAESQAARPHRLTQRVEDNAFHLAAVSDTRLQQSRMSVCSEISKCYRCLIRTGVGTSVAHLICERTRRTVSDPIGVETVVPLSGDQNAVAVNIDAVRSRAAPGQVRSPSPVYQLATCTERDSSRCRSVR